MSTDQSLHKCTRLTLYNITTGTTDEMDVAGLWTNCYNKGSGD